MQSLRWNIRGIWLLRLILLLCKAHHAMAQDQPQRIGDNIGTEFLVAFLTNSDPTDEQPINERQLLITNTASDAEAMLEIEYPIGELYATYTIASDDQVTVDLPLTVSSNWSVGGIASNTVRVVSSQDIVVYQINRKAFTSDAALVLPVDALGMEYIVMDYDTTWKSYISEFVVFAAYDETIVDIRPSNGGEGFQIQLNRGEGYMSAAQEGGDQAGTIVQSNRPVGLVNGNQCVDIPLGVRACDHIFEVAQPVQSWGNEIGVANVAGRPAGSIYRVTAATDNTELSIDGIFEDVLNRGDVYETIPLPGNHVFRGSQPIFVAQFITSQFSQGAAVGDPSFGTMIPFSQYATQYFFAALPSEQFDSNYVTIIAKESDVTNGNILLDGVPVDALAFSPVPDTNYLAAVIEISEGRHSTSSLEPHGVTVHGYAEFDSYLYPGGYTNSIVDENAPEIIIDKINAPRATGVVKDNRPSEDVNGNGILDEGEDLNGNGRIDLDRGVATITLVDEVNLVLVAVGSLPAESARVILELIVPNQPGSGTLVATDLAGNEARQLIEIKPSSKGRRRPGGKGKGGRIGGGGGVIVIGGGGGGSSSASGSMKMMGMSSKMSSTNGKSSKDIQFVSTNGPGLRVGSPQSKTRTRGKGADYPSKGTGGANVATSRVRTRKRSYETVPAPPPVPEEQSKNTKGIAVMRRKDGGRHKNHHGIMMMGGTKAVVGNAMTMRMMNTRGMGMART